MISALIFHGWALAQDPVVAVSGEDPLSAALTEHFGPDTPKSDLCLSTPTLPAVFKTGVTAVGSKNDDRGCRVDGVVVDGKWMLPEEASAAALLPDAWKALPSLGKGEALKAWTQLVLVAFDLPDPLAPASTVKVTSTKGWDVSIGFWQLTDTRHEAMRTAAHYIYDPLGKLIKSDRTKGERWQSTFYTQPFKLAGQSQPDVIASLEQQGNNLARCFHDAWLKDPQVKGRTRIAWNVTNTKPEKFALVDPDMVTLGSCYALQLKKVQFPEGMTGQVIWSFTVDRRLQEPAAPK